MLNIHSASEYHCTWQVHCVLPKFLHLIEVHPVGNYSDSVLFNAKTKQIIFSCRERAIIASALCIVNLGIIESKILFDKRCLPASECVVMTKGFLFDFETHQRKVGNRPRPCACIISPFNSFSMPGETSPRPWGSGSIRNPLFVFTGMLSLGLLT